MFNRTTIVVVTALNGMLKDVLFCMLKQMLKDVLKLMNFIEPKNKKAQKVDWMISERVRHMVKYYAEYSEYNESEVVDLLLSNIIDDEKFIDWVKNKRNNKRIVRDLELENILGEENVG
ncbi:hypothetical protein ACFSTA_15980 [Ornithinibacillus salinisoli]|uniref:IDEAL domain-containing protein n=1 Tax=Ornithinibacillus salinisoli TaxID=1848459 RepID=A0ABW4W016_9BACI